MLLQILFNGSIGTETKLAIIIPYIISVLIIIFLILPIHELAHGWVACKLGDNTAKRDGRLTLNPLPSISPIGSLFLLLFGFGWARPVAVNPSNFKHPRVGMALTALAGPMSNLICGFLGAIILWGIFYGTGNSMPDWVNYFFSTYIQMNVAIAVFNLVPIPPLDGSKILGAFLPDRVREMFYRYQMIFIAIAFVILFTDILNRPLSIVMNACLDAVYWLAQQPFHWFGL